MYDQWQRLVTTLKDSDFWLIPFYNNKGIFRASFTDVYERDQLK